MRARRLTTAASTALVLVAGCARPKADELTAHYPQVARRILSGAGFAPTGGAFVPVEPSLADPVKAAEASLERRGRARLALPARGADLATLTLPGGLAVEVRERGLVGRGHRVGGALAYAREGGTSYWSESEDGFEEWVLVEKAGPAPVAEWEVRGASLWQEGDAVLLADRAGTVRARVTAPRAYRRDGTVARAWLKARGEVLALYTDARGPALVDPGWTAVGAMAAARALHTATLLFSGKVLVVGGYGTTDGGYNASAELFDPATGTFSATGSLTTARYYHTAVLLPSGKVLVLGGYSSNVLDSAELYDPVAGTFSPTGHLTTARQLSSATVLASGQVLVAGGIGSGGAIASAELYDPVAGTFNATGSLAAARSEHTATLLSSGKVLIAGGEGAGGVLSSGELYDPAAGTFSATGSLAAARYQHSATALTSGKVLVVGGFGTTSALASAEVYDPAAGTFSATGSL
ncbi:MAG TPA: kelch repeat-containing protein, partial [Anaeromyxobacteraceae bacterium]|nr:kelch repeat-containing protein [Anaeromyxobacteraceae bacterium]